MMQSCIISQFHDRNVNSKINKIKERALQMAHKDFESNYIELMTEINSVTVHKKSLQLPMIKF